MGNHQLPLSLLEEHPAHPKSHYVPLCQQTQVPLTSCPDKAYGMPFEETETRTPGFPWVGWTCGNRSVPDLSRPLPFFTTTLTLVSHHSWCCFLEGEHQTHMTSMKIFTAHQSGTGNYPWQMQKGVGNEHKRVFKNLSKAMWETQSKLQK